MDAHAQGTGLRLLTFGGLTLTRGGAPDQSPASQRRRLAVLALVAASGARGISRDKLLGYLWPEGEPEQAKQALHQATHALRRALGAEDLFVGTTALRRHKRMAPHEIRPARRGRRAPPPRFARPAP